MRNGKMLPDQKAESTSARTYPGENQPVHFYFISSQHYLFVALFFNFSDSVLPGWSGQACFLLGVYFMYFIVACLCRRHPACALKEPETRTPNDMNMIITFSRCFCQSKRRFPLFWEISFFCVCVCNCAFCRHGRPGVQAACHFRGDQQ